ncbi:vWA domain-containing protein [Phytoactinopolyspora limicola]|uniref:vWA domain-containing protein n=1 Tax=Phytoactinopolyspora limicola TaxID=2715536 RepID=UPI001A9C8A4B|nr:VWA domain-containing protein [Phytoactinopolyspora limicola]
MTRQPDQGRHGVDGHRELTGFGTALRRAGVPADPARMVEFCRAAVLAGPDELFWAGRVTLVSRPADLPVYDRVFAEYFGGSRAVSRDLLARPAESNRLADLDRDSSGGGGEPDSVASSVEVLRRKDFAALTSDELARLAAVLARLEITVPRRRTRRWKPAIRGRPDLRRTTRLALRHAGEPVVLCTRTRRIRPRRLVFLLDVSHSMAGYARALLMFAHAGLRSAGPVEVFCFGTRLTRLTVALSHSTPDFVLRRAADVVLDWDGGTRIGESVGQFLDRYGQAGMARGAVVVMCSDGLETGDPDVLGRQMARLSRLAYQVVWLNPLSAADGYEPLARGMRAALPHVDVFSSGHNLADLETLASVLHQSGDQSQDPVAIATRNRQRSPGAGRRPAGGSGAAH